MTTRSAGEAPHSAPHAITSAFTVGVGIVVSAVSFLQLHDNAIVDGFHYGEYFAYFVSLRTGAFDGQPLTLHGALEYAPAWVARGLAGPDHYFFWTTIGLSLLSAVSVLCFGLVASALLDRSPLRFPLLPAAVAVSALMLSSREVFLLVALWLAIGLARQSHSSPMPRIASEVGLGIAMAVGLFWSFDRGLAQWVAIGAPVATVIFRRPTFRLAAFACLFTFAGLGFGTQVFSIAGYIENMRFIVDVAGQFSYGWTRDVALFKAGGLATTVFAMTALLLVARENRHPGDAVTALMLALLAAVVLRAVTQRADIEHFAAGQWAPALGLLFACERLRTSRYRRLFNGGAIAMASLMLLLGVEFRRYDNAIFGSMAAFLVVLVLACTSCAPSRARSVALRATVAVATAVVLWRLYVGAMVDHGFAWVRRIGAPPLNAAVVPNEERQIAARLAERRVACVMDLTNRGVINGLLDLPSCTRFTYPVYATPKFEDEMIEAIAAKGVGTVVYSSTGWSYRIDGLSMAKRLPKLDGYLRERFPVLECGEGFCIRSTGGR